MDLVHGLQVPNGGCASKCHTTDSDSPSHRPLKPAMYSHGFFTRCKTVVKAWPPVGALFLLLSFIVSAIWLYDALFGLFEEDIQWFEPLSAILGGIGAFFLAAILIFRRVESARSSASTYDLARGLATGYYFNFVRPLLSAMNDPTHSLHRQAGEQGALQVAGLVIGIPQNQDDLDPENHPPIFERLTESGGSSFKLNDIDIPIAGRPRPIRAKLAVSTSSKQAMLVDIPTTLAVMADFAAFVAERDSSAVMSEDEFVTAARRSVVVSSETERFRVILEEFIDVVSKVGSMDARPLSPALRLHVVSVNRLRRRMDELADH